MWPTKGRSQVMMGIGVHTMLYGNKFCAELSRCRCVDIVRGRGKRAPPGLRYVSVWKVGGGGGGGVGGGCGLVITPLMCLRRRSFRTQVPDLLSNGAGLAWIPIYTRREFLIATGPSCDIICKSGSTDKHHLVGWYLGVRL